MPPSKLRQDLESLPNAESNSPRAGFRMTKQRKVVYDVLMEKRDHPTATEVYLRSKTHMPGISLATVYNCLETLNDAGLVKQVNVDREPSRYCPNLHDHAHFFCSNCGQVQDVAPMQAQAPLAAWQVPEGSHIEMMEVAMKGLCANCAAQDDEPA